MLSEEEQNWIDTCQNLLDSGMMLLPASSLWLINKVKELDQKLDELQTKEEG